MKKYLHNLVYVLSNILFPIAGFAYASRILGPEGIGKAQFVLTFAQYFILIAALGIPTYGVIEVAKAAGDKKRLGKLFSELIIINLLTTVLMLVVYLIAISVFGWFQEDFTLYLIGAGLILIGFTSIDWFYVGSEQFRFLSIRSIVVKSISLIALFAFVRTRNDLLIYLIINALTVLSTNIWYLFNLSGKVSVRLNNLELRKHLPALMILFSTTLTISIYTVVDTLLLGFLADDRAVGLYTAAIKINKMLIPVIASLGMVLIPRIARSITNQEEDSFRSLTSNSFAFIVLLGMPLSAGLLVYAPEIIVVFSGAGFADAIPAMQISASLAFIIGLGHLFGLQLLIPGGFQKQYLIATIFGVVTSLFLNILLIGSFREKGAAVAIVMGEIAVSAVSWYFVRRKFSLTFNWMLVLKTVITCLLFIPVAMIVRNLDINPVLRLAFAVAACSGIYFFTLAYIFKEQYIRNLFK